MTENQLRVGFIEKCYSLYEQKMYQVAYRILRDSGLAEDAVHESFIGIMRNGIYFENAEDENCRRYILMSIKNTSINVYNKYKRERERVVFIDYDEDLPEATEETDDEQKELLAELIDKLPRKYKDVANCLVNLEMSVDETAAELGVSTACVRKRFERTKDFLKKEMKGIDNE